jgi:ATP-binding cassette subfamily B protein
MGNLELTDEEMKRCAKLANCHEFIKKLGNKYQTRVGDGGIKLVSEI